MNKSEFEKKLKNNTLKDDDIEQLWYKINQKNEISTLSDIDRIFYLLGLLCKHPNFSRARGIAYIIDDFYKMKIKKALARGKKSD